MSFHATHIAATARMVGVKAMVDALIRAEPVKVFNDEDREVFYAPLMQIPAAPHGWLAFHQPKTSMRWTFTGPDVIANVLLKLEDGSIYIVERKSP